jgi:hypothetical protein
VKANSDYRPLVLDYYPLITPDPPTEEQLRKCKEDIEKLIDKMGEIMKIPKDKFFEQ